MGRYPHRYCGQELPQVRRVRLSVPFDRAGILAQVRAEAQLLSEEYRDDGIHAEALVDAVMEARLAEFIEE